MKHTEIRQAVIDGLESVIGNSAIFFDGRPAVIEEEDFPAVAVYLTDANTPGRSWMLIPGRPLCISKFSFLPRYLTPNLMSGWKPGFTRQSQVSPR